MEENADKLKLQYLAGGSLIKFAPIFSPDASLLFVVTDKIVQVYSANTGQASHVLQGAKDPLISLEYDILNNQILVACTEGGEVIRWNWATGVIRSRVQLNIRGDLVRYQTFNFIKLLNNASSCAVITVNKHTNPVQCFIVNTVDGKLIKVPLDLKLKRPRPIVAVNNGSFKFFVIAQGPFLFSVNYETWEWRKLTNEMNVRITCLTSHPSEELIATGDEKGKIVLWRHFFKINDDVRMTLYHWHSTPVKSVIFSSSGTGFYSSGVEAVLVKWSINDPNLRDYVPRMSSVILHIASSEDSSKLAVSTADNGIHIMDAAFQTKCTLQDFTYIYDDKTGKEKFPIGLRVNPRQNTLVLNGRLGHLQFYSAYTKTMLYNVDVVGENAGYQEDKILYNIRVTQVAHNINWMATAEIFNDEQHLPEVRLKFWHFNQELQDYDLVTNIENAHEGGIRAIEFSNPNFVENLLCATVGVDNIIKIWSLEQVSDIHKRDQLWYCIGQTNYKKLPIESIAFSEDGSLLAAGFGNTLCVYKAENLKLLTALVPGGSFDGRLHKAQIRVPKLNKNGSRNDFNNKRQKLIQLFSNLLRANDETLLKEIKNSVKTRRIQEIQTIDNTQKQHLYKKIRSMNQLNLFQKLLLYRKLGICFQISEKWHLKMVEYVKANVPNANTTKSLNKQIRCLNVKSRFKAKYKIEKYIKRKFSYDQNVANKLAPLMSLMNITGKAKPVLTNGFSEDQKEVSSKTIVPPMQSLLSIKKILFCSGDFAHLVIACTEKRVLIWNLLNLRLQTVLKLSTDQIAIDPKNNLVSVFTKNQELHIFSPSDTLTLYFRQNMPRVLGAVWLPRKQPKTQTFHVNWQSRSILYFLTDNNEIMYLAADEELEDNPLTFEKQADKSAVKYSTFGTFAKNQINNTENTEINRQALSIGVHGKTAIKSFLQMSSHMMAPLSLLCNDFLKSVIELNLPTEDTKSKSSESITLNGHDESSDNEDDYSKHRILIEKAGITTKATENAKLISDEYLQKIAAETIEIDF